MFITDEAIEAAVNLSTRYVTDRYLPDKAIDLIDESASRVRMYRVPQPADVREAYENLRDLREEREAAIERRRSLKMLTELASAKKNIQRQLDQLRAGDAERPDDANVDG